MSKAWWDPSDEEVAEKQKISNVTRFEVIDETGRIYTICGCKLELSWQDNASTLKVFVKSAPERYKKK